MEKLFSDEELAYLPIGFQFFIKPQVQSITKNDFQEVPKFIKIDFYNTDKYKVHSPYKSISKIVKR